MKDERGRAGGFVEREVGGRRARPGAPLKVSENLQRAPGWRSLSILE